MHKLVRRNHVLRFHFYPARLDNPRYATANPLGLAAELEEEGAGHDDVFRGVVRHYL